MKNDMNPHYSTNNTGMRLQLMKAAHIIYKVKSFMPEEMITHLVQFVQEQK